MCTVLQKLLNDAIYDLKNVLTWFFNIYNSIATVVINEKSLLNVVLYTK